MVPFVALYSFLFGVWWGKEVEMDRFVTDLMGKMTIREKLGQLNLPSGGDLVTGSVMNSELSDMIRKEEIGGFFNVKGIKKSMTCNGWQWKKPD